MPKKIFIVLIIMIAALAACSENENENASEIEEIEELPALEVDFEVPEKAEPGDTLELTAHVTYGGDPVTDADEVVFEIWIQGDRENSVMLETENHGDGNYSANMKFEEEAVYEMYAHTTARDLHTMPLKSVIVGNAEPAEEQEHEDEGHHSHSHVGAEIHFVSPNEPAVKTDVHLESHLQMEGKPLTDAAVRFEVINQDTEETEWSDAEESEPGTYIAMHQFDEAGAYTIIVHAENDHDLHEHKHFNLEIME